MDKISKKTIRRIKAGSYGDLMDSIELLIDAYNEDKFNAGYRSCMEDMEVRAQRLAEYLSPKITGLTTTDDIGKMIARYFNETLNGEE